MDTVNVNNVCDVIDDAKNIECSTLWMLTMFVM